jgi:hypothetical protein
MDRDRRYVAGGAAETNSTSPGSVTVAEMLAFSVSAAIVAVS